MLRLELRTHKLDSHQRNKGEQPLENAYYRACPGLKTRPEIKPTGGREQTRVNTGGQEKHLSARENEEEEKKTLVKGCKELQVQTQKMDNKSSWALGVRVSKWTMDYKSS